MALAKAEPGKTRIGWIGTGVMGRWMCQHLLTKGYAATVYNRSQGQGEAAARRRGPPGPTRRRPSPRKSDVVFAIVGFPKDVREVFLGADGALAGSKAGHGAGGHDDQRAVAGPRDLRGGQGQGRRTRVDAPVSGGDVGAKNAALSIMIGGDKDVVEAVRPLFECMGKTIVHQGGRGAGQHTKMVNQILIVVEHDRRVRGAAVRLQGGAGPGDGAASRSASGRPAARRWRCWARG